MCNIDNIFCNDCLKIEKEKIKMSNCNDKNCKYINYPIDLKNIIEYKCKKCIHGKKEYLYNIDNKCFCIII